MGYLGRKEIRIIIDDNTILRALVETDPRRAVQETLVYNETTGDQTGVERLEAVGNADRVAIQYLDKDGKVVRKTVCGRKLFYSDGFNVGKDFIPISAPGIHFCDSIDGLLKKSSGSG
jgi:hypothetical protein